jgi:hypothetical protein
MSNGHGHVAGNKDRCPEPAIENRMYCQRHFDEAMARVAMVSPPVIEGKPWPGVTKGSHLGMPYAKVAA